MDFTEAKCALLESMTAITKKDRNFYSVLSRKICDVESDFDPSSFYKNSTAKLLHFEYTDKYIFENLSHKLYLVYVKDDRCFSVTYIKLNQYLGNRRLKLAQDEDCMYQEYCDVFANELSVRKDAMGVFFKVVQAEHSYDPDKDYKIMSDLHFGAYNKNEIRAIYQCHPCDLLQFQHRDSSLDFYDMICHTSLGMRTTVSRDDNTDTQHEKAQFRLTLGSFVNYQVSIYLEDGTKIKADSWNVGECEHFRQFCKHKSHSADDDTYNAYAAQHISGVLYDHYDEVSVVVHVGNKGCYMYQTWCCIVGKNEKYSCISYNIDDATCAGFVFNLKMTPWSNLKDVWRIIDDGMKCELLKASLGCASAVNDIDSNYDSLSEPDL